MTVTSGPPKIVSLTGYVTVVEGSSVSLVCNVTNDRDAVGTQNVTVLWHNIIYEDDRITITNSSRDDFKESYISTLTINPVLRDDKGQYTCQALNHIELRDSESTNLIVECELVKFNIKSIITIYCSCSSSNHHYNDWN